MTPELFIKGHAALVSEKKLDLLSEVRAGNLDRELFEKEQYVSLSQFENDCSPSLILENLSKQALKQANLRGEDLDFVFFSASAFKEKFAWSQSAELARLLGVPRTKFLDIYQGCNGFLTTLELAILYFASHPEFQHGIISTFDCFPPQIGKKWEYDYDSFYGDGAGIWVISRTPGSYKIEAFHAAQQANLNPFIFSSYGSFADIKNNFSEKNFSTKPSKKEFLQTHSREYIQSSFDELNKECVQQCLTQAQKTMGQINRILLPNFSRRLCESMSQCIQVDFAKTSWELGRTLGHMGSSDPVVNLFLLEQQGAIQKGDNLLLLFHGAGISASCAILEKIS